MNPTALRKLQLIGSATLMLLGTSGTAFAQNYLNFAKDNNIYTDLNEQFPHSGTGVPGSHTGTANANFLFDPTPSAVTSAGYAPDYLSGSNLVNNGVDFMISSDSSGHDFAQIGVGTNPYTSSSNSLTVAAGLNGVTKVELLMGAYNGQSFSITFTGANTDTETFSDLYVPDFNGGGPINSTGTGYADQTVFRTEDVGAGGSGNSTTGAYNNYDLTEVSFTLDSTISSQELESLTITTNGYETLLLGVTANGVPVGDVNGVPDTSQTLLLLTGATGLLLLINRRFASAVSPRI
jgi:hypothetical protein